MAELALTPLSFIVVNRNTADLLAKCLDNILQSNLRYKPEVLVVDNGSIDDSVARVKRHYPEVIVIEAGCNLGFAAANNKALRQAKGDFVLLVNTDALLDKDCAQSLLDLMTADSRVGMVGPQLLNGDGSLQTSYEAAPTLATETLNRSLLKRLFPWRFPGKGGKLSQPKEVEALIGAVMMIRRLALEQLAGFDEDYFFFLEETDLAIRMRRAGWKVVHNPFARAVHLQGATAKTYKASARIEFYRSRYHFFRKHYGNGAASLLKGVVIANLTLNVAGLGLASLITSGSLERVAEKYRVRAELWKWHLRGCPDGPGLPRT
ncbi:MAG: glycosyltransferase family 2 protein [Desulfomonilaceae bacterium]